MKHFFCNYKKCRGDYFLSLNGLDVAEKGFSVFRESFFVMMWPKEGLTLEEKSNYFANSETFLGVTT